VNIPCKKQSVRNGNSNLNEVPALDLHLMMAEVMIIKCKLQDHKNGHDISPQHPFEAISWSCTKNQQ
jgi:hypothetical protein